MPQLADVINYLMVRRHKGRISHFSPHTAGIIEEALRSFTAPKAPAAPRPTERLQFTIDQWDQGAVHVVEKLALVADLYAARAAFASLCESRPHDRITLRLGTQLIEEQPWRDPIAPAGGTGG